MWLFYVWEELMFLLSLFQQKIDGGFKIDKSLKPSLQWVVFKVRMYLPLGKM